MANVGPFELTEPVPELRDPRLLLALRPWIDVGSVGSMTLAFLEEALGAQPLGKLSRPGAYYDFTRYRPMLQRRGGLREITLPNTFLHYAVSTGDRDWILMNTLEPHAHGDEFTEGVGALIKQLSVREYCLIGGMYAPVPHTRPPVASGGSTNEAMRERLLQMGVRESTYEGPTTVLALLTTAAFARDLATASIILQLPAYAQIERDYAGLHALLGLIARFYELPLDLHHLEEESIRQKEAIEDSIQDDPTLRNWITELEAAYDAEGAPAATEEEGPSLSPELERFLRDVERRWNDPEKP